jgi:hypothetical protein
MINNLAVVAGSKNHPLLRSKRTATSDDYAKNSLRGYFFGRAFIADPDHCQFFPAGLRLRNR